MKSQKVNGFLIMGCLLAALISGAMGYQYGWQGWMFCGLFASAAIYPIAKPWVVVLLDKLKKK